MQILPPIIDTNKTYSLLVVLVGKIVVIVEVLPLSAFIIARICVVRFRVMLVPAVGKFLHTPSVRSTVETVLLVVPVKNLRLKVLIIKLFKKRLICLRLLREKSSDNRIKLNYTQILND